MARYSENSGIKTTNLLSDSGNDFQQFPEK